MTTYPANTHRCDSQCHPRHANSLRSRGRHERPTVRLLSCAAVPEARFMYHHSNTDMLMSVTFLLLASNIDICNACQRENISPGLKNIRTWRDHCRPILDITCYLPQLYTASHIFQHPTCSWQYLDLNGSCRDEAAVLQYCKQKPLPRMKMPRCGGIHLVRTFTTHPQAISLSCRHGCFVLTVTHRYHPVRDPAI